MVSAHYPLSHVIASTDRQLDVLILGGGIAGLWTLALLRARGVAVGLLEVGELGSGQTLWSQGIIHGGIKYALTGEASAASKAIARMPEVWREALAGRGEVSLAAARRLSDEQWLWTTEGLISRFAGAAASKAIRTPVERAGPGERVGFFAGAPKGVDVYRVGEPVLDTASVVRALHEPMSGAIARVERVIAIEQVGDGVKVRAVSRAEETHGEEITIGARMVVLTAGAGNEELAKLAGVRAPMQRRPLHMVMAWVPEAAGRDAMVYGHCLGSSTVPRVTVTATPAVGGVWWLVGGAIAESGVERDEESQRREAMKELRACLAWMNLEDVQIKTGRIDRAEGVTASGGRPDGPVVERERGVMVVWPTKLAFAPEVAERVAAQVEAAGIKASGVKGGEIALAGLERAVVGTMPWERAGGEA